MKYEIDKMIYVELERLFKAYWIFKHKELNAKEDKKVKEIISSSFYRLNKWEVPYDIQNLILQLANIKTNKDRCFKDILRLKGIRVIL